MQLSGPIDLIKKSFQIFFKKENLIYFLKLYWILSAFALVSYIFDLYTGNINTGITIASLTKSFGTLPVIVLAFVTIIGLAYLVFSFWIGAAGILAVSGVVSGNIKPVKEVLKDSWKKLWLYSVLSILVGLVVGIGFVILVIPGILFLVWYRFAGFEYMTKDTGVMASMVASKKIVSGKFWKVFGRIIVFGIFTLLVQIVIGLVPFGLGGVIEPLFGALLILPYFLLYKELSS